MTIWTDAQLSPSLAKWLTDVLGVSAIAVIGLVTFVVIRFPLLQVVYDIYDKTLI